MTINSDTMRRKQRREKALFLYSRALDRGDFDTVTAILAQAERDAVLAQMIAELNDYDAAHLFEQSPNGHIPAQINAPGKARPSFTPRHTQPRVRFASITLMAALLALILTSVVLMRFPPFAPAAPVQPTITLPFAAPTSLEATLNANTFDPELNGVWTMPLPGTSVRQYIDLPAAYDQAQLQALVLQNVSYAFQQGIDFPLTVIIAQRNHPIQLLQFGGPPLPTDTPTFSLTTNATLTAAVTTTPSILCQVVVINPSIFAYVRSQPSQTGKIITQVGQGQKMDVVEQRNGDDGRVWFQVNFTIEGNQVEGWVRADLVSQLTECPTSTTISPTDAPNP